MQINEFIAENVIKLQQILPYQKAYNEILEMCSMILLLPKIKLLCEDIKLTDNQISALNEIIKQRLLHKPLSKIVGYNYFYGLQFLINEDVLDPRVETEKLVDLIIELKPKTLLDMGCGCGCIGLSAAKNLRNLKAIGLDISDKALQIATKNAQKLDLAEQISFYKSDWFDIFTQQTDKKHEHYQTKFDVIVSNPPYIADWEEVGIEVKYDPYLALFAEDDGFEHYKVLIKNAKDFLNNDGVLLLEVPLRLQSRLEDFVVLYAKTVKWYRSGADNILFAKVNYDIIHV